MPLLQRRASGPEAIRPDAGDGVLVAAAQRDPRDFESLFLRYWDPILRYCTFRLQSRAEAEDAASQVFVDAYAGLHRFRDQGGEGSFRAWLFTIAHHEVANRHRYRVRHPAGPLDAVAAEVADPATSPERAGVAAGDIAQVLIVVGELPARLREVVELRLAGLNDREIAGVLGISGEAVRQAQSRAVAQLRTRMGVAPSDLQKRITDA